LPTAQAKSIREILGRLASNWEEAPVFAAPTFSCQSRKSEYYISALVNSRPILFSRQGGGKQSLIPMKSVDWRRLHGEGGETRSEASAVMNAKVPDLDKSNPRHLPPAALRALEEAAARRAKAKPAPPRELSGRAGPDPVRYGDWEVKGLASDF
jgi:hypothetical protein